MDAFVLGFVAAATALPLATWADRAARHATPIALGLWIVAAVAAMSAPSLPSLLLALLYTGGALGLAGLRLVPALERPRLLVDELAIAAAHALPIGGGVWLVIAASGGNLLGFGGDWALLTASHFHAAGFGAWVMAGLVARENLDAPARSTRAAQRAVLLLHPVAYGIVAAGITGAPALEQLGTASYLALLTVQAALTLRVVVAGGPRRGRALLAISALVPAASMGLAADWALGARSLQLSEMALTHGLLNALGFCGLGLLALGRLDLAPRAPRARDGNARQTHVDPRPEPLGSP
ncbi:MAG: YndJ family transporter [Nannocystaceae bacterium]